MKGKQGVVFEWITSEGRSCIRVVSKLIIGKKGGREEGITGRMDV